MPDQTQLIYKIAPDGEYLGTHILSVARGEIDPEETKKAGHIVWLVPYGYQIIDIEPPPIPDDKILYWRNEAWVLEDKPPEPEPEPEPEPTPEEVQKLLTAAVQNHMDTKVQERDYDNINTARLCASSTDEVFKAEGLACVAWYDAVWRVYINILNEVTAGLREIPTVEELLSELPELVWPEV